MPAKKNTEVNARNALHVIESRKRERAAKAKRERERRLREKERKRERKLSPITGLALTPDRHKTLVSAARLGMPLSACAALAGITPRTLQNWRAEAQVIMLRLEEAGEVDLPADMSERDKSLVLLFRDFLQAEAQAQQAALATVWYAVTDDRDWRSALEFLRARWPEWNRRMENEGGTTVNNNTLNMAAVQVQVVLPDNGRGDRHIDNVDNAALPPLEDAE